MREIVMSKEDLTFLIRQVIDTYTREKVKPLGELRTLSKNMAEKAFGSTNINRWISNGQIKPIRLGTDKRSKLEIKLEEVYKAQEQDNLDMLYIKERKC